MLRAHERDERIRCKHSAMVFDCAAHSKRRRDLALWRDGGLSSAIAVPVVTLFLALPLGSLDRLSSQHELDTIGKGGR